MQNLLGARWPSGQRWQMPRRAGQPDDQRRLSVAPAADGFEQRNAVVVPVVRRQQVGGDHAGSLQNLVGVAVIDFQDRGTALRLHTHTLEAAIPAGVA